MRAMSIVLSVAVATACSSATAPSPSLTGAWYANVLGAGSGTVPIEATVRLDLTQTGETVTGMAVFSPSLPPVGVTPDTLQVRGQSGLAGSQVCFPPSIPIACHVKFSLVGGDAAGDTLYFSGQFTGADSLLVDMHSNRENTDGHPLRFTH